MPSSRAGTHERANGREKVRQESGSARAFARVKLDPEPNAFDCDKRLRSCGYQVGRHVVKRGRWHVFETDKGLVAIQRHPGGRWEIRRKAA